MRKIMILAISAILVANVSAQELKKECFKGKQFSKEERVAFDIKRLTNELMLSDKQAEKFAVTFREYSAEMEKFFEKNAPKADFEPGKELSDKDLDKLAKARFEGFKELANLQSKYYDKFRKDLSARQVEKVLRLNEPFDPQPCCGKCGKNEGPRPEGFCHKEFRPDQFDPNGPRPECKKHKGLHHQHGPHPEMPAPAPQAE